MANICVQTIPALDRQVIKVKVPTGVTVKQGDILTASTLVDAKRGIYAGAEVTADDADNTVIVINQDVYADEKGNRVQGMVNPSDVSYRAGEIVTAIRLNEVNTLLEIGNDCVDTTVAPVKDGYLVIDTDNKKLKVIAKASLATEKLKLQIECLSNIPVGLEFAPTMIVRTI